MVKSGLVALILGLATFKAGAQGTMLFTWHGNSNFFQASFEITEAESLSEQLFNSTLWTNSIQITSLDGLRYRASDVPNPYIGGIFGPPLNLIMILADQTTFSSINVSVVPGQGASISESSPLPNGRHGESGFWTYELIPEPSTTALISLGAIVWIGKSLRA